MKEKMDYNKNWLSIQFPNKSQKNYISGVPMGGTVKISTKDPETGKMLEGTFVPDSLANQTGRMDFIMKKIWANNT